MAKSSTQLKSSTDRQANQVVAKVISPGYFGALSDSDLTVEDFNVQRLLKELLSRLDHKPRATPVPVAQANRQQVMENLKTAVETMKQYSAQRRSSMARRPSILTAQIVDEYLQSRKPNLSPDSFITYKGILNSFARAFPDLPTQPEPIEEYMARRRRPAKDGGLELKAGTRRLLYSKLSDFYQFAHKRHGLPNVMELIDRPSKGKSKESDYLTLDQLKSLFEAISRRPRSDRLRAYVFLCAGQGLRVEETLRENVEDVFMDRLRVRDGKERSEWIPLLPEVREALLKICQGRSGQDPMFITVTTKARLERKQICNEVRDLFAEAGITGIMQAPKVLRHTFYTLTRKAGCDRASASALMRHHTKDVSDFYEHLSVEERLELLRPKLEQYSPLRQINGRKPDWTLSTG